MAIDWTQTNHVWSEERAILPSAVGTITEGQPLVSTVLNGVMYVKPSAAATTGHLLGFAMAPRRVTTNTTLVTITAPVGGGAVLLPNTVVSGSAIGAYNASTYAQVAVSSSAASSSNIQSGTDSVTGLTSLTFDATDAGNSGGQFIVSYTYTMSTQESVVRYGNTSPGYYATDILSQTGVFRIGRIAINNFDTQANWWGATDPTTVKVVTGGLITSSDGGAATLAGITPTNVDIISFPSTSYPWLVLDIH